MQSLASTTEQSDNARVTEIKMKHWMKTKHRLDELKNEHREREEEQQEDDMGSDEDEGGEKGQDEVAALVCVCACVYP